MEWPAIPQRYGDPTAIQNHLYDTEGGQCSSPELITTQWPEGSRDR